MKVVKYAVCLLIISCLISACASTTPGEISKMDESEVNDRVISDLILLQYTKELKSWKAQSPKVIE